jgi:hypothetical protein
MSDESPSAPGPPAPGRTPAPESTPGSTPEWTMATLDGMLLRALRLILILGLLCSLILWKASGWRDAAMLATGTAISAASTLEWRRLAHFLNAKLELQQTPRGAPLAVLFLMFRLVLFAGAIYGSLKWFKGSAIALFFGLGLALLATVWEALRLLRD